MCFIYIFGLGVFWYFLVINGMILSADPWVAAWVKLFISPILGWDSFKSKKS